MISITTENATNPPGDGVESFHSIRFYRNYDIIGIHVDVDVDEDEDEFGSALGLTLNYPGSKTATLVISTSDEQHRNL